MRSSGADSRGNERSETRSHEEYLELAAVATSGDLTEEEKQVLQIHVGECDTCREALKQFEAAVQIGVPILVSKLSESAHPGNQGQSLDRHGREFAFAHGNGHRATGVHWNLVWLPFAASILLSCALATYAYRVGKARRTYVASNPSGAVSTPQTGAHIEALEEQIADAAHEREILLSQASERDRLIASLRQQIVQQSASVEQLQAAKANLESSIENDEVEKQKLVQEQGALGQRLDAAQASVLELQSALESARQQRALGTAAEGSLQAQIMDLNRELRDREQTINREEELLSHDRDIRDLMGARDLYIAEVYDVDHNAATAKPCGRVFYTKGKSLVFYAYDLDQQPGVRNARTFQAWGRRGADLHQALNLGVFYEDSAAKKRWVVKVNDPRTLGEIDAVFVTVEPSGGSRTPSGKPLLFTYLKIDPNHP